MPRKKESCDVIFDRRIDCVPLPDDVPDLRHPVPQKPSYDFQSHLLGDIEKKTE